MVAGAVGRDPDFVAHLGAFGSRGQLAVSDGVAGSLEEAQSGLQAGLLAGGVVHVGGVDVVALHVLGEGNGIVRVGGLRSSPGRVGDRVVDDGGNAGAVVGVDGHVTEVGEHSRKGLAEVLGSVGGDVAAHVHGLGADAEVAVAEVVNRVGGDHGAVDVVIAVGGLDGVDGVLGVAGIGDVDGAGGDAIELILVVAFEELHELGLRSALEVGVIGLEVHNAVLELHKLVGAGAHGLGGLGLHAGEVALREAELILVVVVEGSVAVVVHRGDGHGQLIDRGSVSLGQGHAHGVIAGLLDALDAVGALAGLHALGVVGEVGEELIPAHVGSLGGDQGRDVVVVGFHHGSPEVRRGGVLCKLIAPVGGALGNGVALFVVAVGNAEISNALSELLAGLVVGFPERSLLFLGPEGEVAVVLTGGEDQAVEALHAGAILFHAGDRQREERAVAVIGRVAQNIHREDDVVRGELLAVGEDDVVAQIEVIGDGAVRVLGDGQVGNAVVGVVRAVVGTGLTGLALLHDGALTVGLEQVDRSHSPDVLVISGLGEERGEFAGEVGVTDDQRLIAGGSGLLASAGSFLLGAAAREQGQAEHESQHECDGSFHFELSSLFFCRALPAPLPPCAVGTQYTYLFSRPKPGKSIQPETFRCSP